MGNSTQWFLIGALIVGIIALAAFYYYDENTISIETGAATPMVTTVATV
ncbi:MAG: hypothetical protein KJ622_12240 [Alphaproteobacteria bacterium]|nr:hypothetical protein [Alphaproteobacteria bacterium]